MMNLGRIGINMNIIGWIVVCLIAMYALLTIVKCVRDMGFKATLFAPLWILGITVLNPLERWWKKKE